MHANMQLQACHACCKASWFSGSGFRLQGYKAPGIIGSRSRHTVGSRIPTGSCFKGHVWPHRHACNHASASILHMLQATCKTICHHACKRARKKDVENLAGKICFLSWIHSGRCHCIVFQFPTSPQKGNCFCRTSLVFGGPKNQNWTGSWLAVSVPIN